MRYCPTCNQPLEEGASFCTGCGAKVGTAPASVSGFFANAGDLGSPAPTAAPAAPKAPPAAPAPAAPTAARPVTPPPAARPAAPTAARPVTPPPAARPAAPTAARPVTPPPAADAPPPGMFAAPPARHKPIRRISVLKELKLLLRQGFLVLLGDTQNLVASLLFPFIATFIIVWIAGENMFVTHEDTKSACFILVCSAIWCGLFNSIQSLVKERENVKRDYVSGALRIECYMGSRAAIQLALCFLQTIILTLSIPIIGLVYGNPVPLWGLLGGFAIFEYFCSLLMIMYAADAMGLMISSVVKKDETASKLAPYVLIVQLLFSGVLFQLKGAGELLSGLTISNWGMKALGSISDLNHIPTKLYTELDIDELTHFPECPAIQLGASKCECSNAVLESLEFPAVDEMYDATAGHLLLVLFVMFLFAIVPLVVGNIMMHRVKHDGRD